MAKRVNGVFVRNDGTPIVRKRSASPQQQFVTIPQTSGETGWPKRKFYELIAEGRIPYVRFDGDRRIWIDRRDLEQFIASVKVPARREAACA